MRVFHLFFNDSCNLACTYCQADARAECATMPQGVRDGVLALLSTADTPDPLIIVQGGEPLLNGDDLVEFLRRVRTVAPRAEIQISTNLTHLLPVVVDFCLEADAFLCVSLDGPAEVHDAFRQFPDGSGSYGAVVGHLKTLDEYGIRYGFQTVITRASLGKAADIVNTYREWGQTAMRFRPVTQQGRATDGWDRISCTAAELKEIYQDFIDYVCRLHLARGTLFLEHTLVDQIRRRKRRTRQTLSCPMGRNEVAIAVDGTVHACDEAVHTSQLILGNIEEQQSVSGLLDTADHCGVYDFAREGMPECAECAAHPTCSFCPIGFRSAVKISGESSCSLLCDCNRYVNELIDSGIRYPESPLGRYIETIKECF